MVALNISRGHKTTKNIEKRGAFTLSIADVAHLDESDYFGIASGNKVADKFERTGMTATKSTRVDAPVVEGVSCDARVHGGRDAGAALRPARARAGSKTCWPTRR